MRNEIKSDKYIEVIVVCNSPKLRNVILTWGSHPDGRRGWCFLAARVDEEAAKAVATGASEALGLPVLGY